MEDNSVFRNYQEFVPYFSNVIGCGCESKRIIFYKYGINEREI